MTKVKPEVGGAYQLEFALPTSTKLQKLVKGWDNIKDKFVESTVKIKKYKYKSVLQYHFEKLL